MAQKFDTGDSRSPIVVTRVGHAILVGPNVSALLAFTSQDTMHWAEKVLPSPGAPHYPVAAAAEGAAEGGRARHYRRTMRATTKKLPSLQISCSKRAYGSH